jgi:hypothetical protein
MAEKLEFDLKVGSNELQKAISDATTGSKKLGDTISTALGTFGGSLALKAFGALGTAINNATGFIEDSVKAAAEQESAFNKLAQSLRITGEYSQQAINDFAAFASQLQKTSVFGDEVVISQIAIAKSLGATNDQAKQLVQAAANLSATFGGTLEENVFKLGKTLGGVVSKELKVVIPELKSLTDEAIKAGAAIQLVNDKFAGAAAAEINTYAGGTTALKNAFSDLQEEIGSFITNSSTVNTLIKGLTGIFQSLTSSVFNFRKEFQGINTETEKNQKKLSDLGYEYNRLKDAIDQARKPVFDLNAALATKEALQASGVKNIQEAEIRLSQILQERLALRQKINAEESVTPKAKAVADTSTAQEIQRIKELEAQKTMIISQAELDRQNALVEAANVRIANEQTRQEAELQRSLAYEEQKRQIEQDFALAKADLIQNDAVRAAEIERINAENQLKIVQNKNKSIVESEKLRYQQLQDSAFYFKKYEDKTNKERLTDLQSTFGQIATLSQSGNKTLSAIGKSAAIANATIDGYAAVQKALASAPPPVNFALAAAVGAATAANVSKIAGVNFQEGGFVPPPGASKGPDNQLASIRTGEMILNAEDQRTLLTAIKSGNMGMGNIVIEIDGREIAKVVRNQVRSGYQIA